MSISTALEVELTIEYHLLVSFQNIALKRAYADKKVVQVVDRVIG